MNNRIKIEIIIPLIIILSLIALSIIQPGLSMSKETRNSITIQEFKEEPTIVVIQ